MRRIYNIGITIAALLSAVSCMKENLKSTVAGGETEQVTIDFCLDAYLTKADADIYPFGNGILKDARVLAWEVYTEDAELVEKGSVDITAEDGLGGLELSLVKGQKYTALFFLYCSQDDEQQPYYISNSLKEIGLNYTAHNISNDAYDIFIASAELDPARNRSFSVTLRRPTVQINISDKVADFATEKGYDKVNIKVTGVGTVLDASTGKASQTGTAAYKQGDIENYPLTDHFLHSMIYVLPTEQPADITLEFIGNGSIATLVVENVVLIPNTRVNILADDLISKIPKENITVQRIVTPDNITSMSFDANGVYTFTGEYTDNVIVEPSVGITATFDGGDAVFNGQIHIRQSVADNVISVTGVRSGSYTVRNFNAEVVSVSGIATTLNLLDNQAEAIDVDGTNVIVNVSGNTVISEGDKYIRTDNRILNEYGIYLYLINYELTLERNTVIGSNSHAIAINGKMDVFPTAEADNVIDSFEDNSLTVGRYQDKQAGLKIWNDATYAPASITEAGNVLIETYKDANTFTNENNLYTAYKFDLNGNKYEQIN